MSLCAIPWVLLALGPLQWGLAGAALPIAVSLTVAHGIYLPIYASHRLALPLKQYVWESMRDPICCAVPYAVCLLAIRLLIGDRPEAVLICTAIAGVLVLGPLYWRKAVPPSFKRGLLEKLLAKSTGRTKVRT